MSRYLDAELEAYYQKDFEKLLRLESDPYWQLDSGLKDYLIAINSIQGIQTLYSRFPTEIGLEEPISYLRLAYVENLRSAIQSLCIRLINELDGRDAELIVREEEPQLNKVYEGNDAPLGCLNNPDYFRVAHYYIAISSRDTDYHKRFWRLLTSSLKSVSTS